MDKYEQLLADSAHLEKLKAAGVNNWEGYVGAANFDDDEDEELWAG